MARRRPARDRHPGRCGSSRRRHRLDRLQGNRDGHQARPDHRVERPGRPDRPGRRDPPGERRGRRARARSRGWGGAASCRGWAGGHQGRPCRQAARLAAAALRRAPGAAAQCCHRPRTDCWRYGARAAVQPQPHDPRRTRRVDLARPARPERLVPRARLPAGPRVPRPPVARARPAQVLALPQPRRRPSWPEPSSPGPERSYPRRGMPRAAVEQRGLRRSRRRSSRTHPARRAW